MSLSYEPDPRAWVRIPSQPPDGWAASAAQALASAQGVSDPEQVQWLQVVLCAAASGERGDEDARWVCATDVRRGGIVLDLDLLDLGDDAPDDVTVDDAAAGHTEEFTAGLARGKRIIWVTSVGEGPTPPIPAQSSAASAVRLVSTPASPDSGAESLQGEALYVARVQNSGYLVTLRSSQHQLDLIVDSVAACEAMLATIRVTTES